MLFVGFSNTEWTLTPPTAVGPKMANMRTLAVRPKTASMRILLKLIISLDFGSSVCEAPNGLAMALKDVHQAP